MATKAKPAETDDQSALAKRWLREIADYERRQRKAQWNVWARHAVDRYLLSRDGAPESPTEDAAHARYNVFWANVENLKPGMYARTPKPVVSRRFAEDDSVASTAAEVVERVLAYQLDEHGFGSAMRSARDDYLLTGRGVNWVRYVPHIMTAQVQGMDGAPLPVERIVFEEVVLEYVHWQDFGHTDARRWEDVRACWRRIYLSRAEVAKRWPGWEDRLAYDSSTVRSTNTATDTGPRDDMGSQDGLAAVFEVWDSTDRQVVFVAQGQPVPIEVVPDPLHLQRFFPCSRPIYATLGNEDLFAVSDYRQYRTQIRQVHALTERIDALTEAVKVVGVYDASVAELKEIFKQADNTLVPVTNYAALAGKGGLSGAVEFIPLQQIAETLTILHGERDKALSDSYQITGIADLIRGDTAPNETATAQTIKNNYVTMRFDEKKREIDRMVVNVLNIMGAIVCRQFSDESIIKMSAKQLFRTPQEKAMAQQAVQSGQDVPESVQEMLDHPTWQEVLALLRDEPERSFRIDIETDSTAVPDQMEQQQQAGAFLQALGGFFKEVFPLAQSQPAMVPMLGKSLEWAIRQFPVGRDLEDALSSMVEDIEKQTKQMLAQQQQGPAPDPAMIKVQGELQLAGQKQQGEMQLAQQKQQFEQQLALQDAQHRRATDVTGMQTDAMQAQQQSQVEALRAHFDAALQQQATGFQQQTAIIVAHINALAKVEAARITADASADPDAETHEMEKGA